MTAWSPREQVLSSQLPQPTLPLGAPQGLRVVLARGSCTVSPQQIEVGEVGVAVRNVSARRATFTLAGTRVSVPARRSRAVRLAFARSGPRAWSCAVRARKRRGLIEVAEPRPAPLVPPRVGVRDVGGEAFFDRATGARFVPRGSTYTRLGLHRWPGGSQIYHSTFQVGRYDAARADRALAGMAELGLTRVVWIGTAQDVGRRRRSCPPQRSSQRSATQPAAASPALPVRPDDIVGL